MSNDLRNKILLKIQALLIADGYKRADMRRINADLQSVVNDIYDLTQGGN